MLFSEGTRMGKLCPVLLAGGFGTRLWPLSRKSYPKQFSHIIGENSLFQEAAKRLISSDLVGFSEQITITNADFRFIVCEQLQEVGIEPGTIIIEPIARNTAAAILAVSMRQEIKERDSIMLFCPSDHVIDDLQGFHKAVSEGIKQVKNKKIVTFGIKPDNPSTSFGYLKTKAMKKDGALTVEEFIEKPALEMAKKMLKSDNFLWNSGIFLFAAKDIINLFKILQPKIYNQVSQAINKGYNDLGFFRLDPKSWQTLENISFDYAIMEKIDNVIAMPLDVGWSDLGNWGAVWAKQKKASKGVVINGNASAINCENVLLRSEHSEQELIGLGLSNIIAITMQDAVLVADRNSVEQVKEVVSTLEAKGKKQATILPKDYRPWGWFESLSLDETFQVKRICVNPFQALSLQHHEYRSEHWIVVKGKAKVTLGENNFFLEQGESVYVPQGEKHRLRNPLSEPLVIIEIQTGEYFGEDDIIRHEDDYSRL